MAITLDGTTGITTPGLTNTGTETIVNLTTTGNTILGDASTDTLNVGNGGLVKDASGNVGIGTASPQKKFVVSDSGAGGLEIDPNDAGSGNVRSFAYNRSTSAYINHLTQALNFRFYTGTTPTLNMTLDTSGNLGLGVTPSTWTGQTVLQVGGGSTGASLASGTNGVILGSNLIYNSGFKYLANGFISYYQQSGGGHYWGGAPSGTAGNAATVTDRMILDTSGNLIVGGLTSYGQITSVNSTAVANLIGLLDSGTTYGSSSYYMILRNSVGTVSGGIQHTASTTVNYATTSDERLKEDKGIATDTSVIDNIIIHDFKWIEDNRLDRGVFAQEAYEIKPSAVGVGSDEVTESGALENPWSVDYSKFVPDLIVHAQQLKKLVEEQQAMIDELKAKVAALEAA